MSSSQQERYLIAAQLHNTHSFICFLLLFLRQSTQPWPSWNSLLTKLAWNSQIFYLPLLGFKACDIIPGYDVNAWLIYGGQRTACRGWFYPSITWGQGLDSGDGAWQKNSPPADLSQQPPQHRTQRRKQKPGTVDYLCNPSTRSLRQEELQDCKDNLFYIARFRPAWAAE